MASKRRVRRKACEGKIRYNSQEEGEKARNHIFHKKPEIHRTFLNVYRCKFCGYFHIGHLDANQQKARNAEKRASKIA